MKKYWDAIIVKSDLIYFLIFRRYWPFFLKTYDKIILISTKNLNSFLIVKIPLCRKNPDTIRYDRFNVNENSCMKN